MAVRIPQYQQQTSPNTLGVQPRARGVQVDDSAARAGMRLAGAAQGAIDTYANVQEQIKARQKAEEEEDAKVWTASAVAAGAVAQAQKLIEMQESAQPGAPDFTRQFDDQFAEYEETTLSLAPNDTAKRFLRERMLALRTDMTGRAMQFEAGERRRWRVDTIDKAITDVAGAVAADPSRLPVMLAEQRAVIESLSVPPEQRAALRAKLDEQVATAAVLGEVERDPMAAQRKLAARLGTTPDQVAGPKPAVSRDAAEINAKYDAIEGSFGFAPTSKTRTQAENDALPGSVKNSQHVSGTARDWSVKGKSPQQVAAFVSALQAEGFEVITKTHGTGPHVHAELPPARAAKTMQQAIAENPEGARVGDVAYDLLTVPQVVQLLGRTNAEMEKQNSQLRSLIAARETDDLAAYGDGKAPPQPITADEFIAAFGGVEGAQRWQRYQSAQQYASELSGLATKTPAEIAAVVQSRAPQTGAGYADASRQYGTLVQAANATIAARNDDPVAFAMNAGIADAAPLNLQDADELGAGLKARVGVAQTMAGKYGTRYTLLTKNEATAMSAAMGGMTAAEKASFLQTVRGSIGDPMAYQSIMAQLRPDSPVTATAGSIMVNGGTVRVGRGGMFSDAPTMTGAQVAQRVLIGEDLLNPTKGDKSGDGKPKFPMPQDSLLRTTWADYVGTAYAGAPDTEADSYQAFRAFYAAELAQAGDYSGQFNADAAERAAAAVTGGVADVNGSRIVLPWGTPEAFVIDTLRKGWKEQAAANGLGPVPFEAIDLQTVGDGVYAVLAGTGPVRGKDGRPLYLRVGDPSAVPMAPASSYSPIRGGR